MMHFLRNKAILGMIRFARDITLDDLNGEDIEVKFSGLWHPSRRKETGQGESSNCFLGLALNGVPKCSKARSRIHVGSWMEIQYQMNCLGIPLDTFPIDMQGNGRQGILNAWFEKYRQEQTPRPLRDDHSMPMSPQGRNDVFMDIPQAAKQMVSSNTAVLLGLRTRCIRFAQAR